MADHQPVGTACRCGQRGWMPGVEHVPVTWARPAWVTNLEGKMQPVVIVDHIMQGWLTTMVDYALQRGPELRKVTPHFNIGRAGRCVQIEGIFTPGIHASALNNPTARRVLERVGATMGANTYSVGIEHEGFSVPVSGVTDAGAGRAALWSPTNPWPEAMVQRSIEVKRWIFAQCPGMGGASVDSIIGHSEVDARNRPDDPQAVEHVDVWPRARMIAALAPPASTPPSPPAQEFTTADAQLLWSYARAAELGRNPAQLGALGVGVTADGVQGNRRVFRVQLPR